MSSRNNNFRHQIKDFLALEPQILGLFLAVFLVTLGEQLWSEFFPAYFIELGGTFIVLGIFKSFTDSLEAISQLPGGIISDKLGRIVSAILFIGMGIGGYIVYLLSPSWMILFIGIILIQGTSSLLQPTIFAFIGDQLPPDKRTNAFSVQSILKRIPIIIAPVVGGYIIGSLGIIQGVRVGLVISVIFSVLAILILKATRPVQLEESRDIHTTINEDKNEIINEFSRKKLIPPKLRFLLSADILARFGQGIIRALLALHVIAMVGPEKFGILISIQMTIAILSYIPAAAIAEKIGRKPVIIVSFICFSLYPSLIIFSTNFMWLIFGYTIAGLKEFGEPARKALIVNLCEEQTRGRSIGLYYTIRSVSIIPAGIIGGILWGYSPSSTGLLASSIAFFGLLVFFFFVHE